MSFDRLRVVAVLVLVAIAGGCGSHAGGGTCGRECPDGTVCTDGTCVPVACPDGTGDCNHATSDGCEVTTDTDVDNCGACGATCDPAHATGACVGGDCGVGACDEGFGDCDHQASNGCEQDTAGDVANCGGCAAPCPTGPHATPTCTGGACGLACETGFGDCDHEAATGCEVDHAGDVLHCGDCATACPSGPHATPTCVDGGCGLACADGFDDCDDSAATGCEVELATTALHCGTCGHACAMGETCEGGTCMSVSAFPCMDQPVDPTTGQRCPIATPCTASPACGTQNAATFQFWYCSTTLHTCQYLPQSGGFVSAAGTCTGQLVVRQLSQAPWDKRIVPPDGVAPRVGTTIAIEVTNTTASDLYLDQLPLTLELAGTNPSRFDVGGIQLYQVGNIGDYGDGNNATQFVCSSPTTPFAAASTFTLGTGATGGCGGSFFSRVRAGMSQRFLLNLTFTATTTFIDGRQYRLRIAAPLAGVRARAMTTGASMAVTACTLPAAGLTGAYLGFQDP